MEKSRDSELHKGHRERLRTKAINHGLRSLSEHERLELMLTYVIPYKDVNPLAHQLLNAYGDIYNLCHADTHELMKFTGVGEHTCQYLHFLAEFSELFRETIDKTFIFDKSSQFASFFRKNYTIGKFEDFYVFCLTARGKLIYPVITRLGCSDTEIALNIKTILRDISILNPSQIIVAHTHPSGNSTPTDADVTATKKIFEYCDSLGLKLVDHIIFSDTTCTSMRTLIEGYRKEKVKRE